MKPKSAQGSHRIGATIGVALIPDDGTEAERSFATPTSRCIAPRVNIGPRSNSLRQQRPIRRTSRPAVDFLEDQQRSRVSCRDPAWCGAFPRPCGRQVTALRGWLCYPSGFPDGLMVSSKSQSLQVSPAPVPPAPGLFLRVVLPRFPSIPKFQRLANFQQAAPILSKTES